MRIVVFHPWLAFAFLVSAPILFSIPLVGHALKTPQSINTPTPESGASFIPITSANVDQLVLGYALSGGCGEFSPNSRLLAMRDGVYEVANGQRRFGVSRFGVFSSNGRLLAAIGDG